MAPSTVFNNGNSKGLIAVIPKGGQDAPNSTVGDNALKFTILCLYKYYLYNINYIILKGQYT